MNALHTFFTSAALFAASQASALTLHDIAEHLTAHDCYSAKVDYEIMLATLSEPVNYSIALESASAPTDSLAPCKYLIKWEAHGQGGSSKGFSAYFNGDHYRFRDDKLQEYHYAESNEQFHPLGRINRGVQRQVQFSELLPQFIGERFESMCTDSTYMVKVTADTIVDSSPAIVVAGVQNVYGITTSEFIYVLAPDTYLPRSIDLENNPGQMGEQNIIVHYTDTRTTGCNINYDSLVAAEPEAFSKYRESIFTLESLPGRQLPRIMAPSSTGERYLHERGEQFSAPTVFVFTDTEVGTTPDLIRNVRGAVAMLPFQTDIVWAFKDHRIEDVAECIGRPEAGEKILFNAGGAARECGIGALLPVLMFVDHAGTVTDIQVGYNNDIASIVIQKVMATKEHVSDKRQ
ncbi:MAG: hypothetical protein K2M55_00045 [Muribaculaceae bacterium]|nr:hypothetical protein [Muribaculaceae bacterium]